MGWLPTAVRPARSAPRRAQQGGLLTAHIQTLESRRRALWRRREDQGIAQVLGLRRGIGVNSAWLYAWNFLPAEFQTPKQVGALAGLTPTPYQSGQSRRELGSPKRAIGISGPWRLRSPGPSAASSRTIALSQWYERRFGAGNARSAELRIVALARKLLIALWRFLKTGPSRRGPF